LGAGVGVGGWVGIPGLLRLEAQHPCPSPALPRCRPCSAPNLSSPQHTHTRAPPPQPTLVNVSTRLPLSAPVKGKSLNCHALPCTAGAEGPGRDQRGRPAGQAAGRRGCAPCGAGASSRPAEEQPRPRPAPPRPARFAPSPKPSDRAAVIAPAGFDAAGNGARLRRAGRLRAPPPVSCCCSGASAAAGLPIRARAPQQRAPARSLRRHGPSPESSWAAACR
jgi:hypothetical protein